MRLATMIHPLRGEIPVVVAPDAVRFAELDGAGHFGLADILEDLPAAAQGPRDWEPMVVARFAPVIPRPGAVWCVGLNYEDHRRETGRARAAFPTLFTRFAPSLVGHGEPMVRPRVSGKLDYEGELAVVIGKPGRHIPECEALDHVAGYTCFNDGSVRDFQRHSSQFAAGKNFFRTGAFGPWLVTADEIPDPQDLVVETRVNGRVMQRGHTSRMTWPIRELIAYLSTITPLAPGDVLVTGTPAGVGVARTPQVFLGPGDLVEVEISGIGLLRNRVLHEDYKEDEKDEEDGLG